MIKTMTAKYPGRCSRSGLRVGPARTLDFRIRRLFRVMFVAVHVAHVSEIIIEAAVQRVRRPVGRPAFRLSLQAPLTDRRGRVARLTQYGGERVVVCDRLVELVVAHIGVALMHAREQRGPRGRADRRRTVVVRQARAFVGETVELRCEMRRPVSRRTPGMGQTD